MSQRCVVDSAWIAYALRNPSRPSFWRRLVLMFS